MSARRVAEDAETRPVLAPTGNKARPAAKPAERNQGPGNNRLRVGRSPASDRSFPLSSSVGDPLASQGRERFARSSFSLKASFSSDCSADSVRSRASTGRIGGRAGFGGRRGRGAVASRERIVSKLKKDAGEVIANSPSQEIHGKRRCAWVTPSTESCYAAFHDEEWGVPVHDDRRLFELLVLSSALSELTWPIILSKRHTFREVFADFDPLAVSKLNEKKITAPGSVARSLLSEPKIRAVIENSCQILKVTEEFGSFDRYCWNFVNHKAIINNFRYPRQVPVKTAKADAISKELVRRGFRGVGPTVVYSFMQAAGITNDHLITCYRFEGCCTPALPLVPSNADGTVVMTQGETINKIEEDSSLSTSDTTATTEQEDLNFDLELAASDGNLSFS